MHEGWIWLGALVLMGFAFWMILGEFTRKQSRTVEEYEADVQANKSEVGNALMRAGMLDLEKRLKPNLESAIVYLEDEKSGKTRARRDAEGDPKDPSETDAEIR
jgi:hypothetical protein